VSLLTNIFDFANNQRPKRTWTKPFRHPPLLLLLPMIGAREVRFTVYVYILEAPKCCSRSAAQ
jgi:hypothetical protein